MKKYLISSELSMDNFTNNILLVKNSFKIIDSKSNPINEVQDNLNDYVFTIANVNVNALVTVPAIDWVNEDEFVSNAFTKLRRSDISGYLINHDSFSEIWFDDHGSDMRIAIKVVELKSKDCVVVSPLLTNNLYSLDNKVSMNLLNNLWTVTQLYEEQKFKELGYFVDNNSYYELNSDNYEKHMSLLWSYKYERESEYIDGTYIYQNITYNIKKSYTKIKYMTFNETTKPLSYYFAKEKLDYNDYDMNSGDLITYTNKDYIDGKQKEHSLLVMVVRSEDDFQEFF